MVKTPENTAYRHSPEHTSDQLFKLQAYLVKRALKVLEPGTLWAQELPEPFERDSAVIYTEDSNRAPTMLDILSMREGVITRATVYPRHGGASERYQHTIEHGVHISARDLHGQKSAVGYWVTSYSQLESQLTDTETRHMAARLSWELRDVIAMREIGIELAEAS